MTSTQDDLAPTNRRRLAPTQSLPSTAESQAVKHGIPNEVSNALQNHLGSRIRQSIHMGRNNAFGRTQSQPAFVFNNDPSTSTPGGFKTHNDIVREAEYIINKDDMKKRELQPYGSFESIQSQNGQLGPGQGGVSPDRKGRKLSFKDDGEVEMNGDALGGGAGLGGGGRKNNWEISQGKKRQSREDNDGNEVEGGDISDTATEIDEDEDQEEIQDNVPELSGGSTNDMEDEFPAVFDSPDISQPELFKRPVLPAVRGMKVKNGNGRQFRGLPGRALGKTVSAPVIMGGNGGMEVDGVEDGFRVDELQDF